MRMSMTWMTTRSEEGCRASVGTWNDDTGFGQMMV